MSTLSMWLTMNLAKPDLALDTCWLSTQRCKQCAKHLNAIASSFHHLFASTVYLAFHSISFTG